MVGGVLIDSNFYISHLKSGRNPFAELASAGEDWELFTCGMVMLEVLRGVRDPRQLAKIEASFPLMNCLPTSNPIWTKARQLAWQLDRSGIIIPAQDHLIGVKDGGNAALNPPPCPPSCVFPETTKWRPPTASSASPAHGSIT